MQRKEEAKKIKKFGILLLSLLFIGGICGAAVAGDTLDEIKKKGVLVAGVKDSTPGFGYIDEKTREIVGYDVDFCKAIAKRLGVRLELKPVTSASRIPRLVAGNIDIAAVTTDESILANILAKAPDKRKYEITNIRISEEPYGLGIRKGDKKLLDFVNATLLEMEKSGLSRWLEKRLTWRK